MASTRTFRRANEVSQLRRAIIAHAFPRLQSTLFLVVAGGAGFVTTFGLLHAGVTSMAIRFPIAVFVAYAVFLLCLRVWLGEAVRRYLRTGRPSNWIDSACDAVFDSLDGVGDLPWSGEGTASAPGEFGGGGGFGGGGSSGSFGSAADPTAIRASAAVPHAASGTGSGSGDGGGWDFDIDFGEGWLIVLPILAAAAACAASLYVVWTAPTLFAELLLDGLLTAGVYRRWRGASTEYWAVGVVRRTWLAALATAIVFWGVGLGLHHVLPTAQSIGDVLRHLAQQ